MSDPLGLTPSERRELKLIRDRLASSLTATPVLIAALSGRALAQSARRAGYAPFVADVFGDLDMREAAAGWRTLPEAATLGFSEFSLLAALAELSRPAEAELLGLVLGGGFDHIPDVIEALSRHYRIIGNTAATVHGVTDPIRLSNLLSAHGVAQPATRVEPPAEDGAWLLKRIGGGGGLHVGPYESGQPIPEGHYVQRRTPGESISALCVMEKDGARLVGLTRQWTSAAPGRPFRYGGAAGPVDLSGALAARVRDAAKSLSWAFELIGLVSFDFLVDGETPYLLEINPRPGATIDIFDDEQGSLFSAHVESCLASSSPTYPAPPNSPSFPRRGEPRSPPGMSGAEGKYSNDPEILSDLGSRLRGNDGANGLGACANRGREKAEFVRAAAYLYADGGALTFPEMDWPDWAADRSPPGRRIPRHQPLATVIAQGKAAEDAEKLCRERLGQLEEMIYGRA